jgi:hypothetical protein
MSRLTKLLLTLTLLLTFFTATAHAATYSLKPVRQDDRGVTFRVDRLPLAKISRAHAVTAGKRHPVAVSRLRTAVRRGYLRVASGRRVTFRAVDRGAERKPLARMSRLRRKDRLVVVTDTVAPVTTISTAPSGAVTATSASVGFKADEAATFECKLDAGAWESCVSPRAWSGLQLGAHTVAVRATDTAGNVDATPATASWNVVAAETAASPEAPAPAPAPTEAPSAPVTAPVVADSFDTPNGNNSLISNQYAFWGSDPLAVRSSNWEVTSGSLFSRGGRAWSGPVDATTPDRYSQNGTGSFVFRMRSAKPVPASRQEVSVKINSFWGGTSSRPAVAWDGVVLWPRYQTEHQLYFGYILRKDGRVAITKKCAGQVAGGDYYNGGSYFSLVSERYYAPTNVGQWYRLGSEVQDNADGSVTVRLLRDGVVVAQARDAGLGCAPIRGDARVGVRADNTEFELDDYRASPLT